MDSWLSDALGISDTTAEQIIATVIAVVVIVVARALIVRALTGRMQDTETVFRVRKTATYGATIALLVGLARIWSGAVNNLGTFLGLLTAGIAIALADVFLNLAGWVYIVVRRPFRAGDRVEIAGHAGDVVDIRILRFTLLEIKNWVDGDQSTGRLLHLPNALLFRQSMANYTEGFNHIWHELALTVTFESDWQRAEELIRTALEPHHMGEEATHAAMEFQEAARHYLIKTGELEPTVFVTVKEAGVELTARLLVHPRERRLVTDKFWRDILVAFADEPNVEFAYPTIRAYGA